MIEKVLKDLEKNNIYVTNCKRAKKSGQKEVYFIEVNGNSYVLKISNVTPYYTYDDYGDDPEIEIAIEQNIMQSSARIIQEVKMAKECNILPQLQLLDSLKLLNYDDKYYLYYIEERFEGDSLKYAEKYKLSEINEFLLQLVRLIKIMDSKHYVHRDIKPDNIIYNEKRGIYLLIDAGICKNNDLDYNITVTNTPLGTPRYMAPEQRRISSNEKWNFQTDLYPLGLIAIEMFLPALRVASNEDLRDMHYVFPKWQEKSKTDLEIKYFKKIIVNLCQTTRALRFNDLSLLEEELLKWKESLENNDIHTTWSKLEA